MLQSVPLAAPKTYLGIYNFKQTQTEVEFLCHFYSNKRTNGRKNQWRRSVLLLHFECCYSGKSLILEIKCCFKLHSSPGFIFSPVNERGQLQPVIKAV